jgi:hypothetical protein
VKSVDACADKIRTVYFQESQPTGRLHHRDGRSEIRTWLIRRTGRDSRVVRHEDRTTGPGLSAQDLRYLSANSIGTVALARPSTLTTFSLQREAPGFAVAKPATFPTAKPVRTADDVVDLTLASELASVEERSCSRNSAVVASAVSRETAPASRFARRNRVIWLMS